jgi:regulator of protease activity HflC (stomatin/prohibitin superfamily)
MVKYPEFTAANSPPQMRGGVRRFLRFMSSIAIGLMVTVFAILMLWPYMVITVPPGHVGVLWKRINGIDPYCWCFVGRGTVLDPRQLREEGLHVIAPWDKLYIYNLRLQSKTLQITAISKDGVNVLAQMNVRFQLVHRSVGVLHKFIGPNYLMSIVAPEIGSLAREIISRYPAQEVYTSRQKIQAEIRQGAQQRLDAHLNMLVQPEAMEQPDPHHYNDFLRNSMRFLDTLVLNIELPPQIVAAINRQTEQFYQIQEYKFRVAREAEESKRKQVEANGIAAFQRTVSKGISESYLRWRGIEATLALARSPNSKIVVIGSGKDGLPIILGNVDTPSNTGNSPQPKAGVETPPPGTMAPAPSDKIPPAPSFGAAPPKPAEGEPPAAGTPSGPSDDATPSGSKDKAGNKSSAAPSNTQGPPDSSGSLSLSDIKAILSKLAESVRPSTQSSDPGPQRKQ